MWATASNTWPAVNVADAAALVRLGVEKAPAGSVLHAVGEQGVQHRDIAQAIGRRTGLPVRAFAEGEVAEKAPQFAWLERFLGVEQPGVQREDAAAAGLDSDASDLIETSTRATTPAIDPEAAVGGLDYS